MSARRQWGKTAEAAEARRRFEEASARPGAMIVLPSEGEGRWVGGSNPDAHRHRCSPPMRHVGCCDGTGGHTITEADTHGPMPMPEHLVGQRTVCISGRPDGGKGARWLCNCGQGWVIGDACGCGGRPHAGQHRVGLAWRRLGGFASWRLRRTARRSPA